MSGCLVPFSFGGEVSVSGFMFLPGSLCPGGFCPGGSLSGGSLSRGFLCQGYLCPGGNLSRGSLSKWVSVQETRPPRQKPPYSKERAVRILLECILVFVNFHREFCYNVFPCQLLFFIHFFVQFPFHYDHLNYL